MYGLASKKRFKRHQTCLNCVGRVPANASIQLPPTPPYVNPRHNQISTRSLDFKSSHNELETKVFLIQSRRIDRTSH